MKMIKKAVIPVAGLGTRFLPVTKTIPKEMLPLVDRPALLYLVDECIEAGIEDLVLVQGRNKGAIEDFFDSSFELETKLESAGDHKRLNDFRQYRDRINIISIRQKQALGLGHAVACARPVVGDAPFAVLLGDEIMVAASAGSPNVTAQMVNVAQNVDMSVVAVMEVPKNEVNRYGVVAGSPLSSTKISDRQLLRVDNLVEKPDPKNAPTCLAMPGRYVFTSAIFECLKDTRPGKNGEIQLTDAMVKLAQTSGLVAATFNGRRYDTGNVLGFLQANIELALDRAELRAPLIEYLKGLNLR